MLVKIISTLLVLLHMQYALGFNSDSRQQFAFELVHKLTPPKTNENVIVSPVSVHTCMAMAYIGADGKTADEMRNGLFLQSFSNKEDVAADFGEFLQTATKSNHSKVEMANRVYVSKKLQLLPEYSESTRKHFQSEAESVDFGAKKDTANNINNWVKAQTHDKIQNLIDASILSDDTAVVLVNAIYFKAEWLYGFDPSFTMQRDFQLSEKEQHKVPTMFRANMQIRYGELPELELVAVELPYKDTELRMLILLPNKVDGVAKLVDKLDVTTLQQVTQNLKKQKLDLFFPKFKIEFDLSLVDTMKAMGMQSMFSDADLHHLVSGASGPLYVSEIKHKAYISVDEIGSEASGATFVQSLSRSARYNEKTVMINRPFVFMILDDKAIYFFGHVAKL